jgi:hypothetical protein
LASATGRPSAITLTSANIFPKYEQNNINEETHSHPSVLDISSGFALNKYAPDHFIGSGFSIRLPK